MRVTDHIYVLSGSYYGAVGDQGVLGDVYGIRTEEGMILIDCGYPETGFAMINETLDYYGIKDPVTHLLITHGHHDHCGSAKAFQDLGASVIVGAEDGFQCVNGGSGGLETPFRVRHLFPAFVPDVIIENDQAMTINGLTFSFYKTPGHTPGSMAIAVEVDRKKALFTGDAVQPRGGQLDEVGLGWQGDLGFSRADIVKSMMKLVELDVDMILPGHGKVCLKNGNAVLQLAAETAFLTMR